MSATSPLTPEQQQQFHQYMKQHNLDSLFNDLTKKLVEKQPLDPIQFMIDELERKDPKNQPRKVVFVLGGPGSGKGTQCARLVEKYKFAHFSAGDLLRAESTKDTETGRMINNFIKEGKIVPGEVTIALLKQAIMGHEDPNTVFLIDGFPREMKQAVDFERQICFCQFVLFFDCPEDVLESRLLKRGQTSGRIDDNIESIKKRFQTYINQTMPVIQYFKAFNKVKTIDSSKSVDLVFEDVCKLFD
ncbi:hypothetical protein C9374_000605 [Naegleria lovaniensis]|uniref:UMP-CMP kinase n=1 Tax=Naegleria lovaniensis TaxID=51637 RepID=A0AA88GU40_NAELO|nr:uncharacterized protein C9374_000605 [Naegleria lovaniensis]KAG2388441.1 hypothetical protein C9374_000605 [Naegleria lovaniensis]